MMDIFWIGGSPSPGMAIVIRPMTNLRDEMRMLKLGGIDTLVSLLERREAEWLGLEHESAGRVAWDVFDAVLTPGEAILLENWRDRAAADAVGRRPEGQRQRIVRIVRDYGMFDRREAPQYYAPAARR